MEYTFIILLLASENILVFTFTPSVTFRIAARAGALILTFAVFWINMIISSNVMSPVLRQSLMSCCSSERQKIFFQSFIV